MQRLITGCSVDATGLPEDALAMPDDAFGQAQQLIMPALRTMPTAQIGCGAAQDQGGPAALSQVFGGFASVIMRVGHPGRLLVTGIVLFVQHDQTEIGQRREKRRARADHHIDSARPRPLPAVIALAPGQAAMQKRHSARESFRHATDGLRRQRDLWHKQDGAPANLQGLVDSAQVDFGFAAAGYAMQQVASRSFVQQRWADMLPNCLLIGREKWWAVGHKVIIAQGIAPDALFLQFQHTRFDQPVEARLCCAGGFAGFFGRGRAGQLDDRLQDVPRPGIAAPK